MESRQIRSPAVLLGVLLLICSALCDPVHFKDCGSVGGVLKQLSIDGCTTVPCTLRKGTNAVFKVDFTMNSNSKTATSVVDGIIAGVPIPFKLPENDACKGQGLNCPLTSGKSYTFVGSIPVSNNYPEIRLVVKWAVVDDQSKNIFCWMVPVMISA